MPQSAATRVVLSMIAATCVTLITNVLDTSPTISLIGATLAAAVPALINAGGPYGVAIGLFVTAAALGVTYVGFTAADAATDRPLTFPAPEEVKERVEDEQPTVTTDGGDVSVPHVVGMPYEEAETALEDVGLNVERQDVESSDPPDTVVAEDPAAETLVEEGTTIKLSVSQAQVEVAKVIGQSEAKARSRLESDDFQVAIIPQATSDPTQDGLVVDQSPSAGTMAPRGSTVTLTVGTFA